MAWVGRSLSDFGSQIGQARDINLDWRQRQQNLSFEAARQKQTELMAPLLLLEVQQRIKALQQQQAQADPAAKIASVEKLLGRPMTSEERAQFAGFKPQPTVPKYNDVKINSAGQMTGVNSQTGKLEIVPGSEQFKYEVPGTPKPETGYADTSTDTRGNKWGFNKASNKFEMIPVPKGVQFPVPREGQAGAPGDVDALSYDIASGRAKMPTGKFGAAVAQRMKALGLEPPAQEIPKELQSQTDKLQKIYSQVQGIQGTNFKSLSPEDSVSLAKAADDITGGTARTSELKARGGKGLMGYRWYSPTSFNESEAKSIYVTMAGVLNAQINTLRKQYEKAKIDPPDWLQPIPPTTGERLK